MIKNTPAGASTGQTVLVIFCYSLLTDFYLDIPQLESALTKIGAVVATVNENKRKAENSEKIFEIQQQLEAGESLQLLSPTRRFIMEGKIAELSDDRYQIAAKFYYFLFNGITFQN